MTVIRNIVVATDFSEAAQSAAIRAVSIARLYDAAIHLVHALRIPIVGTPHDASIPASVWKAVRGEAARKLETLRVELEGEGAPRVTAALSDTTDPVRAIEQSVRERAADLVVMGTHGYRGLKRAFLGSVAERTIRALDCPVLGVKERIGAARKPIERILVPLDFSAHSDEAVSVAAGFARRCGAAIELLHAIDFAPEYAAFLPPEAMQLEQKMRDAGTERLETAAARLRAADIETSLRLARKDPTDAIAAEAERLGADLIVMGTHGHTGLQHLMLGSVAERTLRTAPCPVLAVTRPEAGQGDGALQP